jgi:hypothetical protein
VGALQQPGGDPGGLLPRRAGAARAGPLGDRRLGRQPGEAQLDHQLRVVDLRQQAQPPDDDGARLLRAALPGGHRGEP